jgi:flagellar basal body-associated protein FliL
MLSAMGPIGPVQSGGSGSWVWVLLAVALFLAFLAVTWFVGLWGSSSRSGVEDAEESTYLASSQPEKKAA